MVSYVDTVSSLEVDEVGDGVYQVDGGFELVLLYFHFWFVSGMQRF